MITELLDQMFLGAVHQLWEDYVGDPQCHLWAHEVLWPRRSR